MGAETGTVVDQDRRAVEVFVRWDRLAAIAGTVFVIVANAILQLPLVWLIVPGMVVLIAGLTVAQRQLRGGLLYPPLVVVAVSNWFIAMIVALVLPFLWPVMALTVLMPLVLATPYVERRHLPVGVTATALTAGIVATIGLINDDGGALPDIDDVWEVILVVGTLMAQIAPIGLIVWLNNQLQLDNIARAAALNAELRSSQERLASSRRRVVEAGDTERRRIERDLHDGAQQRLVALGVRLRLLESQTGDHPTFNSAVTDLVTELEAAVEEVRELARGIYPPLLRTRGLVDALSAVVRRSALDVTTTLDDVGRLDPSVETALYFTALEALTNAAKHAPGSSVELVLLADGDDVRLSVADDGPGFVVDEESRTEGTNNMGDRIASVGGELDITSTPGRGTTVSAVVPRS